MSINQALDGLQALDEPDFAPLVEAVTQFLKTEDPSLAENLTLGELAPSYRFVHLNMLGEHLAADVDQWGPEERLLTRFLVQLSSSARTSTDPKQAPLRMLVANYLSDRHPADSAPAQVVAEEIAAHHEALKDFAVAYLSSNYSFTRWELKSEPAPKAPFLSPIANLFWSLSDDELLSMKAPLGEHPEIFVPLAAHRPTLVQQWVDAPPTMTSGFGLHEVWAAIIKGTDQFDPGFHKCVNSLPDEAADLAFRQIKRLDEARNGAHRDLVLAAAGQPLAALHPEALAVLLEHRPTEVLALMTAAFQDKMARFTYVAYDESYTRLFQLAKEQWTQGGAEFLVAFLQGAPLNRRNDVLATLLEESNPELDEVIREGVLANFEGLTIDEQLIVLEIFVDTKSPILLPEMRKLLTGKSKQLRDLAAKGLASILGTEALPEAAKQMKGKTISLRVGAVALFAEIGGEEAVAALQSALASEKKDAVRTALQEALDKLGSAPAAPAAPSAAEESPEPEVVTLAHLEASIAEQAPRKLPKGKWLRLAQLPPLPTTSGEPLSESALTFLIAKQSAHKTITAAPDIVPFLAHLDRAQTTDFALALFEQWLGSDQAAADRWVLTLTGLLCDARGIPVLQQPIANWADNSRHKMAEYSAQAIALIPGDEALMVLDGLATRYRSKYKNIGKACLEALETAAANRGVSLDELGDLIVPNFGFDAEGQRTFEWDGGTLVAQLAPDFKLSWLNPVTVKETKTIPASTPASVKAEVKALNKLIREGVKSQATRLEMGLVRQRRWQVPRWQELFETNPLLQSFATRLVWGLYNAAGELQRTFRRYPNGLLADADGDLVELDDPAMTVGMIHPLELDSETLTAWGEHLKRFKVMPPFPQLERPVMRLDSIHGNRKELSITTGKQLTGGTFRSRAERRGWARGSIIDGGGINSYYKDFPGAGVEVFLLTEDFWVGFEPTDILTLGPAYFTKAKTIQRGSYTYDEPDSSDDPRVLRFDQVPAVVYSETLSDLAAIVE